jgi:cytochrome c oxidase subunit 3
MSQHGQLREPYATLDQQRTADKLGMFVFLATEIMLFSGLFAVAFVLRILHRPEYVEASRHLHLWIGGANTLVLLTSSLAVALAVALARRGAAGQTFWCLLAAALLGLAFLGIKAFEYSLEYGEGLLPAFGEPTRFAGPVQRLFMDLYLIATSLHALHVTGGIILLAILAWRVRRGATALPQRAITIELGGLYWHLVDAIWVFLYPVLYLAR